VVGVGVRFAFGQYRLSPYYTGQGGEGDRAAGSSDEAP
jgi:hypothetical protein